jgi:hypothetical protein
MACYFKLHYQNLWLEVQGNVLNWIIASYDINAAHFDHP